MKNIADMTVGVLTGNFPTTRQLFTAWSRLLCDTEARVSWRPG